MASPLLALLAGIALVTSACGGQPAAPTSVIQLPTSEIRGVVTDTTLQNLADVRVEVVSGPGTGLVTNSGVDGSFVLTGPFGSVVTFRATKNGYRSTTRSFDTAAKCQNCGKHLRLKLELEGTLQIEPGNYTLTFHADSACVDIPAHLRTRVYNASIQRAVDDSQGLYDVRVPGMLFEHGWFAIGINGNRLITEDDSSPTLFEPLPDSAYLGIDFLMRTELENVPGAVFSVHFPGTFEYCSLKSGQITIGFCEKVPPANLGAWVNCWGERNQMIISR